MKLSMVAEGAAGSAGFGDPVVIVILVMMLGGTVFLWKIKLIRPKTAYITLALVTAALIFAGVSTYGTGP